MLPRFLFSGPEFIIVYPTDNLYLIGILAELQIMLFSSEGCNVSGSRLKVSRLTICQTGVPKVRL